MKSKLITFIFVFIFSFLYDCPIASSAVGSLNSDCSDGIVSQAENSQINTNNMCIRLNPGIDLSTNFVTFNISFYKITLIFEPKSTELGFIKYLKYFKPHCLMDNHFNFSF